MVVYSSRKKIYATKTSKHNYLVVSTHALKISTQNTIFLKIIKLNVKLLVGRLIKRFGKYFVLKWNEPTFKIVLCAPLIILSLLQIILDLIKGGAKYTKYINYFVLVSLSQKKQRMQSDVIFFIIINIIKLHNYTKYETRI